MRSWVRERLARNAKNGLYTGPDEPKRKPKPAKPEAVTKPTNHRRTFTEAEGDALLKKLAPDWELHLYDGRVLDRIVENLP